MIGTSSTKKKSHRNLHTRLLEKHISFECHPDLLLDDDSLFDDDLDDDDMAFDILAILAEQE